MKTTELQKQLESRGLKLALRTIRHWKAKGAPSDPEGFAAFFRREHTNTTSASAQAGIVERASLKHTAASAARCLTTTAALLHLASGGAGQPDRSYLAALLAQLDEGLEPLREALE